MKKRLLVLLVLTLFLISCSEKKALSGKGIETTVHLPNTAWIEVVSLTEQSNSQEDFSQHFPLMMINLQPSDIPAVKDLIDIAMYYTSFAPFTNPTNHLRVERAVEMIDAAKANEIKVIVNLGLTAHPYVSESSRTDLQLKSLFPEIIGDGVRVPVKENGEVTKYDFYEPTKKVKLPTQPDDISADYISYRSSQDEEFLQYLIDYDTSNTIVAWYGAEEIRYYHTLLHRPLLGGYGLQVGFKKTIDKIDPHQRPLLGSLQHNWDAEITVPYTLLELGDDSTFLTTPTTKVTLALDQEHQLKELQQHIVHSNYLGQVLGEYGATNRIESYHTIQKGLKAVDYVNDIYKENNKLTGNKQQSPLQKVFHAPDLSIDGPALMNAEDARHDFWSGVLDAQGVLIYNYAFADDYPEIWNEYKKGLLLIKQGGLRNYLLNGTKSTPEVTVSLGKNIIPGNDYTTNGKFNPITHPHLILPDYDALNARVFRIADQAYLLVSHSYNQKAEFSIDLKDTVQSVQVIIGEGAPTVTPIGIADSFSGIDARVYKITFKQN